VRRIAEGQPIVEHFQFQGTKIATGDCIMPKDGIFAKVVQGVYAKAGDSIVLKT
jgi:hypothetical protein